MHSGMLLIWDHQPTYTLPDSDIMTPHHLTYLVMWLLVWQVRDGIIQGFPKFNIDALDH